MRSHPGHMQLLKKLGFWLADAPKLPAQELKDEILSRVFGMFAGHPLIDDVTVVVAEIPAHWKASGDHQEPLLVPAQPEAELLLALEQPEAQPVDLVDLEINLQQAASQQKLPEVAEAVPKKSYKIKLPNAS